MSAESDAAGQAANPGDSALERQLQRADIPAYSRPQTLTGEDAAIAFLCDYFGRDESGPGMCSLQAAVIVDKIRDLLAGGTYDLA